jgi:hypothetical protein
MESVTGVFKVFSSLIFGLLFFSGWKKLTKVAPLSHFFSKMKITQEKHTQPHT